MLISFRVSLALYNSTVSFHLFSHVELLDASVEKSRTFFTKTFIYNIEYFYTGSTPIFPASVEIMLLINMPNFTFWWIYESALGVIFKVVFVVF